MILNKITDPFLVNKQIEYETALIIAVKNQNVEIVKKLLSISEIDPSISDKNDITPIEMSAKLKNLEIFNLIYDFYGENINHQKRQLEKSIKIILEYNMKNDLEKFLLIIEKIINLKCIDVNIYSNKCTLFIFACNMNSIDMVKSLIQYETLNINLSIPKTGDTPFHILIMNRNYDIAQILINHPQININKSNYDGYSPLILAIKKAKSDNDPFCDLILNSPKFNPKESDINLAFYISNNKFKNSYISKKLLSFESLDINYIPFEMILFNIYFLRIIKLLKHL